MLIYIIIGVAPLIPALTVEYLGIKGLNEGNSIVWVLPLLCLLTILGALLAMLMQTFYFITFTLFSEKRSINSDIE
jgi:hypothetical protein